ncbi:MAG: MurR/RpiR family transcriptional regulator [Firmicutes bacterium]|jgi:DNA-binding MurR/RpiR family transcriptional regulator|nr:MurR/RpiR family transcriptional regulator [Bacillota bacterium]MDH7495724.1 MurR/RpiR family transcriptional regulator [Bacillota bacterium]
MEGNSDAGGDLPVMLPAPVKIKRVYDSLNSAERKAAEFVLQNPKSVVEMGIAEVARAAGCSTATLSRFARRIGYENYREFRTALEPTSEPGGGGFYPDVQPSDDYGDILRKVFQSSVRTIEHTLAAIDVDEYRRVLEALSSASRVVFFAIGDAAAVAHAGCYKFARIGYQTSYSSDPDVSLVTGSLLRRGDMAVGISHSGQTTTVIRALKQSKKAGATTVAITNFPLSPIVRIADHVLLTAAFAESSTGELMAHRVAQLCVLEALWVGVLQKRRGSLKELLSYIDESLRVNKE